jgi:hypothetical protein
MMLTRLNAHARIKAGSSANHSKNFVTFPSIPASAKRLRADAYSDTFTIMMEDCSV